MWKLSSAIFPPDDSARLNEDSYLNTKDYEWEAVKSQFINLLKLNNDRLSKAIYSNNRGKLFNVRLEKKFLIYNTYAFKVKPTKLTVSTNVADTNVMIAGTELKLEDTESSETVKIYPGIYPVTAVGTREV